MINPFLGVPTPDGPDDWRNQAACKGDPHPDNWFPDVPGAKSEAAARALDICSGCPVATQCATYAHTAPERYGIWGGLTEPQRKRMRQAQNRPANPNIVHGTNAGYQRESYYKIPPCPDCKEAHRQFQLAKRRIRERAKTRNNLEETG